MTKSPTIMSNEGPSARNVRIKANVVRQPDSTYPIVIEPPKIEFAASDSAVTMEFSITNKATDAVTPRIVSAPTNLVSINLTPEIPALVSAKGTMTLTKAGLMSSFEKSLTIQLDDRAKSRFTIPIKRVGIGQAVVVATGGH